MKVNSILNKNFNIRTLNNLNCQKSLNSSLSFKGIDDIPDSFTIKTEIPKDFNEAFDKLYSAYFDNLLLESRSKNLEIYDSEILPNKTIMAGYDKFKQFMQKYLGKPEEYADMHKDEWIKPHKDSPIHVFLHYLEQIRVKAIEDLNNGGGIFYEYGKEPFIEPPNGIGVISVEKQLGEDFLDCVEFFSKFRSIEDGKQYLEYNPYEEMFKTDFVTAKINPEQSLYDLQESMINALEDAGERFKQTGRKTILHVKDMQDLINPKKNADEMIAEMKDYMQCSVRDYQTIYTLAMTNPEELQLETVQPHRIGMRIRFTGLDKKQARGQMDELLKLKDETKDAVDELTRIYSSHTEELHGMRLKYLDRYKVFVEKRDKLRQLYQNPEENRAKILAILSEKPVSPVDTSTLDTVSKDIPAPVTKTPIEPPKPVIEKSQAYQIQEETKTMFSKIKDFSKNNKVLLATVCGLTALCGIGAFIYFKGKNNVNVLPPQTPKPQTPNTLLKNTSFSDFLNKK